MEKLRKVSGNGVLYPLNFPKVVCLCGSTRFADDFNRIGIEETLKGHIVVRPEVVTYDPENDPQKFNPAVKDALDWLHKRKIDMADEVVVVNKNGYVGESTKGEVEYARRIGKVVRFIYAD